MFQTVVPITFMDTLNILLGVRKWLWYFMYSENFFLKLHVFAMVVYLVFQQYIGNQTTIEGIPVDHWRSCMYMASMNANYTLDYYFTSR